MTSDRLLVSMIVVGLVAFVVLINGRSIVLPLHTQPGERVLVPAPHTIPQFQDMAALRLAMVHDVLHERYTRHGRAWHEARIAHHLNLMPALESKALTGDREPLYDAMDDLAVSLDRLDRDEEAIVWMRRKWTLLAAGTHTPDDAQPLVSPKNFLKDDPAAQEDIQQYQEMASRTSVSKEQHQRYTCLANLGTALVHGWVRPMLAGDAQARAHVEEGLRDVQAAMQIDPQAHYGRETWQSVAIAHLLAASVHPHLLRRFDLIGDSLGEAVPPDASVALNWSSMRSREARGLEGKTSPTDEEDRILARLAITRVGFSPAWVSIVHPRRSTPAHFDEPTLGIVGMWTMGGGPSPHAALALGEIMLRVGERYLAWEAFERAAELADGFSTDTADVAWLRSYCRARQLPLLQSMHPSDPIAWDRSLRYAHEMELAQGSAYQKAYQDYEASQLAHGVPFDSPALMSGFTAVHGGIATTPGNEDDIPRRLYEHNPLEVAPVILLCSGLTGAAGALLQWLFCRSKAIRTTRRCSHGRE